MLKNKIFIQTADTINFGLLSYIKVGYLLHLVTLIEIQLIRLLMHYEPLQLWLSDIGIFGRVTIIIYIFSYPVFPQLDAWSRFQNYKMLRDQFFLYGFQKRIAKPFSTSRCQRDAVRVAAGDLGYEKNCSEYFKTLDLKWYHILPNFLYQKPFYLLDTKFWTTTFGVKYYSSRISFDLIKARRLQVKQASPAF